MKPIIIVDYDMGNLRSVMNALEFLGIPAQISRDSEVIKNAEKLILPGVGAAGAAMQKLHEYNLVTPLLDFAKSGKPLLGICLGMQLLFDFSEEGQTNCLGIIPGLVKLFAGGKDLKVPQIGWNQVKWNRDAGLCKDIPNQTDYYFVNSFYCQPENPAATLGVTDFSRTFTSVVEVGNVCGVQFHPEKSGELGLKLLKNFYENYSGD